ncbi:MAG: thermonuclease family protein [Ferruginibacter sp.]
MKILVCISFLFWSCFANNDLPGENVLTGVVVKIIDGDTFDVLLNDGVVKRIRIEGIDAPERKMPYYKVSKDYLAKICLGQRLKIVQTNTDRNGRLIAKTILPDGREAGFLMVEAGMAWHFKRYSKDMKLAEAEKIAKQKKIGLWADAMPVAPWEWRKKKNTTPKTYAQ